MKITNNIISDDSDALVLESGDTVTIEHGVEIISKGKKHRARDAIQSSGDHIKVVDHGYIQGFVGIGLGGGHERVNISSNGTVKAKNAAIQLHTGYNSIAIQGTVTSRGQGVWCGLPPYGQPNGTGGNNLVSVSGELTTHRHAIRLVDGGNTIHVSGTVTSTMREGIYALSSPSEHGDTVVNTGHITGGGGVAIQFGNADDSYNGRLGTITGAIYGNGGADHFRGGRGAEVYGYSQASDSTKAHHDTIVRFNAHIDSFIFPTKVTDVETESGQNIRDISLQPHEAVLFTAASGHTFLVVDGNGVAGYQAGHDYVIELQDMKGHLTVHDFHTGT